ncbi:hypothetical protein FF011L_29730 [Roseimaritima multifibrata]|uniref:Uncharacterized protein n=1 Tax=Roseimaritima multifibrata TaxID=1930274 RepID=A0A517MH44_9BACT|nr:hypothetical protein [Roseimaritima multifibrata]QDS94195.1 hypothetical protein FF011L_29730 [Roseimaritima multifibrata]
MPYEPKGDDRLCLIVEPIDPPQGLLLGQNVEGNRVAALLQYVTGDQVRSDLENVDGQNVGNRTTVSGSVFKQGRLSQVIVTVRKDSLHVDVAGQRILTWEGAADRQSLGLCDK